MKRRNHKGKSAPEVIASGAVAVPITVDVVAWLEEIRQARGISQYALSAGLGRAKQFWANTVRTRPPITLALAIAVLNVLRVQLVAVPVDHFGKIEPFPLPSTLSGWRRDPARLADHRQKILKAAARRSAKRFELEARRAIELQTRLRDALPGTAARASPSEPQSNDSE